MPPKYENHSSKFLLKSSDYHKQFSHVYAHHLAEISGLLAKRASKHWGQRIPLKKLSVLRDDFEEEFNLLEQHNADPEDKVILEDELQRIRLFGKITAEEIGTGMI
uniref:Uncharacterized protein n=1 Tax=Glossina palpalis gambiensis TaxID=67801 RepID=A0A1B0BP55_9MUSC